MEKGDIKKFIKQAEERIAELRGKAGDVAKALGKSTSDLSREGMLKVEQLTLEHERSKLVSKLGEEAFKLLRSGKLKHADLNDLLKEIKDIENKIRGKKIAISKVRKKPKKK